MSPEYIKEEMQKVKRQGDIGILSIHWGGNWGYDIPSEQIEFAHRLIDRAGIDIIHGHSSHHVKGIEVYRDRLILYGCGDFLNDYEGIGGFDYYRSDLGLMYFVKMDGISGSLAEIDMIPTQIRHFRVNRASREDAFWLADLLKREGKKFGTGVELGKDNALKLLWG